MDNLNKATQAFEKIRELSGELETSLALTCIRDLTSKRYNYWQNLSIFHNELEELIKYHAPWIDEYIITNEIGLKPKIIPDEEPEKMEPAPVSGSFSSWGVRG